MQWKHKIFTEIIFSQIIRKLPVKRFVKKLCQDHPLFNHEEYCGGLFRYRRIEILKEAEISKADSSEKKLQTLKFRALFRLEKSTFSVLNVSGNSLSTTF